jgi:CheY-like chemotaxis protein
MSAGGTRGRQPVVLVVEDDPGDTLMIREALEARATLECVGDGVAALDYLRGRDGFADAPRPDLILLDLNLPRKNGRDVLAEVKADAALRSIPIIVLTTSDALEDVRQSYDLHANAFVTKPVDFDGFTSVLQQIDGFFHEVATLPE